MDPASFSKPEEALLTSVFFCCHCQKANAVKIKYLPEGKIEFDKELDVKTIIKDEPIPFFIGHPEEVEEVLSNTGSLSLLVDTED